MKVLVAHEEVDAFVVAPAGQHPIRPERGLEWVQLHISPRFFAFWCNASEEAVLVSQHPQLSSADCLFGSFDRTAFPRSLS